MQKTSPTVGRLLTMVVFVLSCFGLLLFLWLSFGGTVPLQTGARRKVADDLLHEWLQILRAAAGDEIAVAHHFPIEPSRTGVDEIVTDAGPGSQRPALQKSGRREDPWTVTKAGDRLPRGVEGAHELPGALRLP